MALLSSWWPPKPPFEKLHETVHLVPVLKRKLAYVLLGIILVLAFFGLRAEKEFRLFRLDNAPIATVEGWLPDAPPAPRGAFITVHFDLKYDPIPEVIESGVAFRFGARVVPSIRGDIGQLPSNVIDDLNAFAELTAASALLELHLAGSQPEPRGPQTVGSDMQVLWSITLDSPRGAQEGFISIALATADTTLSMSQVAWVELDTGTNDVEFSVRPSNTRRSFTEKYVAQLALYIGLIIAFSNVVRFYWAWADRKKLRAAEEARQEDERPKILKP